MKDLDLSTMRHRDGGKSTKIWSYVGFPQQMISIEGAPDPAKDTTWHNPVYIHEKDMWDVVVKDFRKRSAAGEIFNNPKLQREQTFTQNNAVKVGSMTYRNRRTGRFLDRWPVDEPMVDSIENCRSRRTLQTPPHLVDIAVTAAYAGVSANTQNAVLWAGEARETVKMVSDIGAGLLALYKRTAKQRKAWAKGKLTIPEAQSLTLGLLYGILPLEQSIAQVTEGLFKLKPNGRETSRGFQVYTDTNSKTWTSPVNEDGLYDASYTLTESLETVIRAGVLYDVDVDDFPALAIIADPKQIVETAYALARLSFVIDWFINVGNTLMAWAPSTGTKVLSAWVTITETYKQTYSDTVDAYPRSNETAVGSGSITGALKSTYEVKTSTRHVIDRSDLAILPRLDINLNFSKLNSLVLLFADAKKKR